MVILTGIEFVFFVNYHGYWQYWYIITHLWETNKNVEEYTLKKWEQMRKRVCHYSQSLRHHNRLTHLALIKQSPSSISFSLDIPLKFSKATIRGVKMQQWFAIVLKSRIKQHTSYWKQDFQKTLYNCYYTAQPVHNSVLSISPADGKQSCTSIHQRFFSFCLFNMSLLSESVKVSWRRN